MASLAPEDGLTVVSVTAGASIGLRSNASRVELELSLIW